MILVVQVVMIGACILEQLSTHWSHWLGARLMDVSDLHDQRAARYHVHKSAELLYPMANSCGRVSVCHTDLET